MPENKTRCYDCIYIDKYIDKIDPRDPDINSCKKILDRNFVTKSIRICSKAKTRGQLRNLKKK